MKTLNLVEVLRLVVFPSLSRLLSLLIVVRVVRLVRLIVEVVVTLVIAVVLLAVLLVALLILVVFLTTIKPLLIHISKPLMITVIVKVVIVLQVIIVIFLIYTSALVFSGSLIKPLSPSLDLVTFSDDISVRLRAKNVLDLFTFKVLDQDWSLVHLILRARARAIVFDVAPHVDLSGVSGQTKTKVKPGTNLIEPLTLLQSNLSRSVARLSAVCAQLAHRVVSPGEYAAALRRVSVHDCKHMGRPAGYILHRSQSLDNLELLLESTPLIRAQSKLSIFERPSDHQSM